MASPILRPRYSTIGRLPVAAAFFQFLQHGAGETKLGQGGFESIVALEFLSLLRRHVGLEKNLGGIELLGKRGEWQRENREDGEEKQQPDFVHRQEGG